MEYFNLETFPFSLSLVQTQTELLLSPVKKNSLLLLWLHASKTSSYFPLYLLKVNLKKLEETFYTLLQETTLTHPPILHLDSENSFKSY